MSAVCVDRPGQEVKADPEEKEQVWQKAVEAAKNSPKAKLVEEFSRLAGECIAQGFNPQELFKQGFDKFVMNPKSNRS